MTIGSHQRTIGKSQVHITPQRILRALGEFDLDPCAADPRPWDCATTNYTERQHGNGLAMPWFGRVFLNPPFHRYRVASWVGKLAQHGRGAALLHARTEAEWFEPVWASASAILFLADRIKFFRPDGSEQPANSGAPAVLVAFGAEDADRLRASQLAGFLVERWLTLAATEAS